MQNKKLKVFIIAGEVSGDVLGGKIMHEMPNTEFVGIGGEHMRAAGLKPIFPMRDLAVMGAIEVLAHARTLTKRIKQTVNAIINERPDVVLTIDSPGFAQNVISKIRRSVGGRNLIANGIANGIGVKMHQLPIFRAAGLGARKALTQGINYITSKIMNNLNLFFCITNI